MSLEAAVRNRRWSLVAGGWPALHHRIVSTTDERMAAQDAVEGHPGTAKRAVALDCLHRVLGAGGNVTARGRQHRRDHPFIASQELERDEFGNLAHFVCVRRLGVPSLAGLVVCLFLYPGLTSWANEFRPSGFGYALPPSFS
jgi:hypothetical protein